MQHDNHHPLSAVLSEMLPENSDQNLHMLLECAQSGFAQGANDFVLQAAGKSSAAELKDNLTVYPIAQLMIAIVKYYDLTKDVSVVEKVVGAVLESLDGFSSMVNTEDRTIH